MRPIEEFHADSHFLVDKFGSAPFSVVHEQRTEQMLLAATIKYHCVGV
jgi:hypothetical protein